MHDLINKPEHYTKGIETIDYIESWGMDYKEGNIVKYVTRYKHKGDGLNDLRKAKWYLERLIEEERERLRRIEHNNGEVTVWKRESPGATGDATRRDEYRQLSAEEEHEYIQSLNRLYIEPGVPFISPSEDDDDWSEENCRRPIMFPFTEEEIESSETEQPPVVRFAKGAICDDPCYLPECQKCILKPEANVTPYPAGWPYTKGGESVGPCHRCKEEEEVDRDFRSTGVKCVCGRMADLCSCGEDARDILSEIRVRGRIYRDE